MANVGEQLKQPESGMKRIDNTFYAIKYNGTFLSLNYSEYYNSSCRYTRTVDDYIEFYVYTSKLYILDLLFNTRSDKCEVYIDGVFSGNINAYKNVSSGKYNTVIFVANDMTKSVHHIKIINKTTDSSHSTLCLDCIDIDEDGYMVYKGEDGKLYYDVTPIMTSNNTPAPYVVSASSEYNVNQFGEEYRAWKAFDAGYNSNRYSTNDQNINQWINLNFDHKQLINCLYIVFAAEYKDDNPKECILQGSDNGTAYVDIKEFTCPYDNDFIIDCNLSNFSNYRLYIKNGYGNIHISIDEIRYLLAVDTPLFLIEDNGAYYNIDDSNSLVQVNDISKLGEPAITNECIYDVSKIIGVKSSLSANAKIISNKNYNLIKNRIYNKDEMIIANGNIVTRIMADIKQILGVYDLDSNCSIKMVVSEDNGATWLTTPDNGSIWDTLDNTVDLSVAYKDMTDEQKTQWNSLMEEIKLKGYDITTLSTIDYSRFNKNVNGIRHAYVISIVDADSVAIAKNLQMKFDAFGDYVQMAVGTEVNIRQSDTTIVVTPTNDTEDLLVNIGLSSDRAIEGGGGSSEEFTYTTSDVDNIVNGL